MAARGGCVVLIMRSMPNIADVPENAAFRRWFYSKWGKENCVITGRTRLAEYPPYMQRLSIKAAWGGTERYLVDSRVIGVDDDNYLVLNDRREYSSVVKASEPMHSFSIFFRPGLAEEMLGSMVLSADEVLGRGSDPGQRAVEFSENLRPHDNLVTPVVHYIAHYVERGFDNELWYEEQFIHLLERLLRSHHKARARINELPAVRRSTRQEVLRRIGWGTDYIHSFYARELTVDDLAKAAHLSKYHFVRLFSAVHRITPYAFVQRKRACVARRLLETTRLPHHDIAARVGFENRSTMFRQLVRWTGHNARTLRRLAKARATASTTRG